jgi:hypothetical protein
VTRQRLAEGVKVSSQDFGEPGTGESGGTDAGHPQDAAVQPGSPGPADALSLPRTPDSWSQSWQEAEQPARQDPLPQPGEFGQPAAASQPGPAPPPAPFGQPGSVMQPDPFSQPGQFGQAAPATPSGQPAPPPSFGQATPATEFGQATPAGQFGLPAQPAQFGQADPPGQFGQPAGSPQWGEPGPVVQAPNNKIAIWALVCGIGQFVLGLALVGNILLAIPAIILGAIGMKQTAERGQRGRGMAMAGLILGILGVVYFLLVVAAIVVAVHHARH